MQSSGMTYCKQNMPCMFGSLEAVMQQKYALSIYNYNYNYAILHKLILYFTDPAGFLFSNLK